MATLEQIEQALRAADAAGNTDDARRLAQAYASMRDQQPKADFSNVQGASSSSAGAGEPGRNDSDFARLITGQPRPQVAPAEEHPIGSALGKIGGRQVLQGAAGLYGALGGDAVNDYLLDPLSRATGGAVNLGTNGRSYRQAASDAADSLGMQQPETAGQRVASDIGEGLTGTALTMGIGGLLNAGRGAASAVSPTVRSKLGELLTAQPALQTVSSAVGAGASSATREAGGGRGAQVAASLIGSLAPGVASTGAAAAARGLARGSSGEGMRATIGDFNALGANPSIGQASQRSWLQGLEGLLSKGPTSSGVMGGFAESQADDIGRGLQNKAESLSPGAGSENAGLAIERGMQSFKGDTNAIKKALYWAVDQQIPGATPTPMSNTARALQRLTTPNEAAPATTGAMIQPRIAQLRKNLETDLAAGGGRLPYDALKRIRSDIGEAINGSSPLNPSSDLRELNQLYGALSDDMLDAAKSQGPRAVMLAQRANSYTRNVANRMELVQRVLDKNGGPEKVFSAAMSGTNDGATTLRGVMYSLPQAEQKAVSAAVIKRMGLATAGNQDAAGDVFSASTFLTNWAKLSPESKQVLFGRYGSNFKESMNQIARVAENIKSGSKVYANPSGSADKGVAIGYWVGMLSALASGHLNTAALGASGGAAANAVSRFLTTPYAVNWLASQTKAPVGSMIGSAQALITAAEEKGDTDVAAVASALRDQVRDNGNQQSDRQQRKYRNNTKP